MKKIALRDPLPRVDAYVLHLYCKYSVNVAHDTDTHGAEFSGKTRAEAHRQARKRGWTLHRDRTSTCPKCSK